MQKICYDKNYFGLCWIRLSRNVKKVPVYIRCKRKAIFYMKIEQVKKILIRFKFSPIIDFF